MNTRYCSKFRLPPGSSLPQNTPLHRDDPFSEKVNIQRIGLYCYRVLFSFTQAHAPCIRWSDFSYIDELNNWLICFTIDML